MGLATTTLSVYYPGEMAAEGRPRLHAGWGKSVCLAPSLELRPYLEL